ncbi:MAG: acetylglutamate kinase [Blastocatellia bacterium]
MKRTVIKLGGSILVDDSLRRELFVRIAGLVSAGHQLILVHGGGRQIARMLERLGVESRFHDGLRVTDGETRDVVQMVLAGLIGRNLTAELGACGVRAVSLAGADGRTLVAERMSALDGTDLGYVGRIVEANPALIDHLLDGGYTPVIACLAVGRDDNQFYNVNGDQMAAAVAVGVRADTLILVTDVGGVLDAQQHLIRNLTPGEIDQLLSSGVASGGMRPKLRACLEAIGGGVQTIRIVGAAEEQVLDRALGAGGDPPGTTIVL